MPLESGREGEKNPAISNYLTGFLVLQGVPQGAHTSADRLSTVSSSTSGSASGDSSGCFLAASVNGELGSVSDWRIRTQVNISGWD